MNKLDENLERLRDFAVKSFEKKYTYCGTCGRLIKDSDDVAFTKEYGQCLMCDSERFDIDRRIYDEVNGGVESDEDRTDAYIERIK